MVPVLLYLLVKKYVFKNWPAIRRRMTQVVVPKNFLLMAGFLMLMLMKLASLKAQDKQLQYNILRNGKVIGWTKLTKTTTDQKSKISLESEVKARFIFLFVVSALEEAAFERGVLVYSSQFRKTNSDVKENKTMKLTNHGYEMYKGKDTEQLQIPILRNHMLSLYFDEPTQCSRVYSDSFQRVLDIERLGKGGYKINLPDGNSSSYYYENGICTRVEINHRMYSAEMVLSK